MENESNVTDNREQTQVPQDLAAVLSEPWPAMNAEALRDTLYLHAFTRQPVALSSPPLNKSTVLKRSASKSTVSPQDLVRRLSMANGGQDRWEHGWNISKIDDSGAILAHKGPHQQHAKVGNYALTHCQDIAPQVGMAVSVYFPRESVTLQTGVYYAFGESLPSQEDQQRPLRLYFNIDVAGLDELYSYITHTLNDSKIPFTLKSMLEVGDRDRADATVLYLPKRFHIQLERLAEELPDSLGPHFRSYTPLCTKPLGHGVGLAESPSNGESFGMHRCRLIAEGLLEAREAAYEDAERRLAIVRQHFARAGIDIYSPHLIQNANQASHLTLKIRTVLNEQNIVAWFSDKLPLEANLNSAQWRVTRSNSRNHNFNLQQANGADYFIKQLRVLGVESSKMMAREAAVYRYLSQAQGELATLSPAFYDYIPEDHALILQRLPHTHSVTKLQTKSYPPEIAVAAANTLGKLHKHNIDSLTSSSFNKHFELNPPGIYTAHHNGPLLQWLSNAQMQIIERIKKHKIMAQTLDTMAAEWRNTSLIHGDVKWENSIWAHDINATSNQADAIQNERLKWVDWELADLGNPYWDAGCFLQAYFSHWAQKTQTSLHNERPFSIENARLKGQPLWAEMQPATQAFIQHYLKTLAISEADKIDVITKIMHCAAARLIQMSLEVMHGQPQPAPATLALLSTSIYIFEKNECAIDYFLGDI